MCFDGPDIPPQDPRFAEAAMDQINLARQQYADYIAPGGDREFMRNAVNEGLGIVRRGADRADQLQQYELEQARFNDQRYRNVSVPYEDRLIKQIEDQDSEPFREEQVRRSLADTQTQFDSARQQNMRAMGRIGVNPGSGAFAGMMNDGGRAQALAMATAANKTRLAAQQVGLSNKMQMYGGMKGMAGLGATSASLALGAGGQQIGAGGAVPGVAGSYLNANNAAASTMQSGMSAGISGYNGYYGNSLKGAQIAAENDPGNMILGTLTGVAGRAVMGKMG